MVPKQRQTAGRGQRRAKNRKNILSQRMPDWRPRRKDPAQPLSPVSCQSRAAKGLFPHRKTGHTPLGHLRWGPILTSHQDCQDVWGLPSGKERQLSDCPSFSSCPGTFPQPPCALYTRLSCPGWDLAIQGSASRLYDPLPYGWGVPWENGAGVD